MSNERIQRLMDEKGLSDEARRVVELVVANLALDLEDRLEPEELGIFEAMDELSDEDRAGVGAVFEELMKGKMREVKEGEAFIELAERVEQMRDIVEEKYPDLDTTGMTMGQIFRFLEEAGEELPITEDELNIQMELPEKLAIEEADKAGEVDWITIPSFEMPVDEHGIPTGKAASRGFGQPYPPGSEKDFRKVYPRQVAAMRAIASDISFRDYVEEQVDEIIAMVEHFTDAAMEAEAFDSRAQARDMAKDKVNKIAHTNYLHSLAAVVQEYPGAPDDIVAFYRDETSRAANRYERYLYEQMNKDVVHEYLHGEVRKLIEQDAKEGLIEIFIGEDGKEYIRLTEKGEKLRREGRA